MPVIGPDDFGFVQQWVGGFNEIHGVGCRELAGQGDGQKNAADVVQKAGNELFSIEAQT